MGRFHPRPDLCASGAHYGPLLPPHGTKMHIPPPADLDSRDCFCYTANENRNTCSHLKKEEDHMRTHCIYAQVMVQMFMRGWNMRQLAEETDISYVSLRRKLRGESPFTLEEAFAVRDALQVELSLDALFEKRRMAG